MSKPSPSLTLLSTGICAVLFFCSFPALAQDALCEVKVSGTENSFNIKNTSDPFAFDTHDLEGGFRFSAQVLLDPKNGQSKLKTFTYHQSKNRYVLIHASESSINTASCHAEKNGFGLQRVYSHKFERELSFSCKAVCATGTSQ
ncbi:hypothetical protein ACO0LM_19940 [Undibacterium sp. Di26W]|uniref:hypothetical protein n=1 Tax=Undibacterium sp. Di26W TaxID=3413035 RepID=UPI003BF31D7B